MIIFMKYFKNEIINKIHADKNLQVELINTVNLFREHWKTGKPPKTIMQAQADAAASFFKIAGIITQTYATQKEWEEKQKIFERSFSRQSNADPRPARERSVIDELIRNAEIGYQIVVQNETQAKTEFQELYGKIKRYFNRLRTDY